MLILAQSSWNKCTREICGKSAFHGAHSDMMCLSEGNAEILVKAGEYLDSSLHDKIVSRISLITKSMTYGRISPFDVCHYLNETWILFKVDVVSWTYC